MEPAPVVKEKVLNPKKIFYIYKGMLIYISNNIIKIIIFFKIIAYKSHKKKEPKTFICPFKDCQKSYNLKNILLAHLRIHYGIKPFECKYCNKSFNEKGNLKTHIRIHTGERPFKCKLCQKGFKALGQLKDHLISHTGYKPFQCPHCKKFYRRKEILKNHIIIHSKENFFKNNQEKFQEMLNEVKLMKHIKYNFDELEKNSLSKNDLSLSLSSSKEEQKQNNISTNLSNSNHIEEKEKSIENQNFFLKINKKEKENEKEKFEKIVPNFNKVNDEFKLNDKLYKYDYCNAWPNEINNLLQSTIDISTKEENNNIFVPQEFNLEKKKIIFKKPEKENDICTKQLKTNNLYLIFYGNNVENKNKYENDEYSNMTNLYLNDYEHRKDIDDFVNKF